MKAHLIFFNILFFQLSLVATDPSNNPSWRAPIKCSIEQYKIYLPNQYACFCTRLVHKWSNSLIRKDELKKLVTLDELLSQIDTYSAHETWEYIHTTIGPFRDEYGKNFSHGCWLLLKPFIEHDKNDTDFGNCPICLSEKATHILATCGHVPFCQDCFPNNTGECPLCRTPFNDNDVIKKSEINQPCVGCHLHAPQILHLNNQKIEECERCHAQHCELCDSEPQKIVKVFSNGSLE